MQVRPPRPLRFGDVVDLSRVIRNWRASPISAWPELRGDRGALLRTLVEAV